MGIDVKKLVTVLRHKREAEGLSLRGLSSFIGVSFSTLARIERGDGEPDNNSLIRILEWLGDDGRESGLSFDDVAFVHFRAAKSVQSKTIHCLLQAANILKRNHGSQSFKPISKEGSDSLAYSSSPGASGLSKLEMERMAEQFRSDLKLRGEDPLDALSVEVDGVIAFVPSRVPGLSKSCLSYLTTTGSHDWSAMSVPLDAVEDRWAILRNDRHKLERQRVTYLEECWHILLGHKLTKIAKISDAYGRTYDSSEEHDAYYLASASLLPERAVTNAVRVGKSATEIGEQFGITPELVEYRIKRLGLWLTYKRKAIKMADGSGPQS